jgi:hypothetical protein
VEDLWWDGLVFPLESKFLWTAPAVPSYAGDVRKSAILYDGRCCVKKVILDQDAEKSRFGTACRGARRPSSPCGCPGGPLKRSELLTDFFSV